MQSIVNRGTVFLNFHCGAAWAPWCPHAGAAAVSWRVGTDHHDTWHGGHGTAGIVDVLGQVANRSGPYRYSDPDFLMTGGAGCDDEVYKPGIRCPGQTDVEYVLSFQLGNWLKLLFGSVDLVSRGFAASSGRLTTWICNTGGAYPVAVLSHLHFSALLLLCKRALKCPTMLVPPGSSFTSRRAGRW